jgi:hypothetical protein
MGFIHPANAEEVANIAEEIGRRFSQIFADKTGKISVDQR